jgi:hypothetical protein
LVLVNPEAIVSGFFSYIQIFFYCRSVIVWKRK